MENSPGGRLSCVVIDQSAHSIGTVDQSKPQHGRVPDNPEGVSELSGDESEVNGLDAFSDHQVDEQVPEDEDDEDDARGTHVNPAPLFPVDSALLGTDRRPRGFDSDAHCSTTQTHSLDDGE